MYSEGIVSMNDGLCSNKRSESGTDKFQSACLNILQSLAVDVEKSR